MIQHWMLKYTSDFSARSSKSLPGLIVILNIQPIILYV